ncbi:hypothetical protein SAMN02745126_04569 [Enhydrobacter aerosaccus]|uniref:Transposase n=1 Tax=Enhydrobacter aerosaccus TaxID=225324 RepID=A0A1T4SD33_9HYPH|nr:hypothetical protein [Enhydrobacter aerosaccus]SKA25788.1 hypothetical protein SAMN02745126_04569 [Enhydrobacter aerosaccus]
MADSVGRAPSTINRIWKAFGVQPHRSETFKLWSDQLFAEKVRDIVDFYLDPPDRSVVPCVDEKSQVQAGKVVGQCFRRHRARESLCAELTKQDTSHPLKAWAKSVRDLR